MDSWYTDRDVEITPVFTEGMCSARPDTGPDGAYAVSGTWSTTMSTLVQGEAL